MMRIAVPRSAVLFTSLCVAPLLAPVGAQGRTIDEGVFVVTRRGAPTQTESFRIARMADDLYQATGQLVSGDERASSTMMADSIGTPVAYGFVHKTRGATTAEVRALAGGGRLSLKSSDTRGNETMRDFPVAAGQCVLLDDDMMHQLFFVVRARRAAGVPFQVIVPGRAQRESAVLTPHGLESVEVAGRSVTATHYSLVSGLTVRQFWADAAGRLLRVEIPGLGLTAIREDLPQ